MAGMAGTAQAARTRPATKRRSFADGYGQWPLQLVFVGFPIWWVLGLASFFPHAVAVAMAWQLLQTKRVAMPRGFGWWLLFLAWMAAGAFLLLADAPGAVPGGGGAGRLMVFAFRAGWYLTCTVVLLWVANSAREALSLQRFSQAISHLFIFTTLGGWVGMIWPELSLSSPFEMILPRALANNGFMTSLVHLNVADIQTLFGDPEPRPKMPFPYANTWGSVISLSLPFFLVTWFKFGRTWQRALGPLMVAAAAVPIVYSLNRGLWFSLAVGAVLLIALQLRTGRPAIIGATAVTGAIVATAILASPLSTLVQERFENQHSNDRRSQLLIATVESTLEGSPLVGFGSTRDVQGSFASIAGGATPDCPACGVPPLGTQGQLWLVIFSQGFVGLALFLAFFLAILMQVWRCRSLTDTLCCFVLVFFGLQLFVYDTLGMPMYIVMAMVGMAWRERRHRLDGAELRELGPSLEQIIRRLRPAIPAIATAAALGGTLGFLSTTGIQTTYSARADVLLAPTPQYLATFGNTDDRTADTITIDTEAALVFSEETLERLPGDSSPNGFQELRSRIKVTAPPNTSILTVEVSGPTSADAESTSTSLVTAYLDSRRSYLEQRRQQVLTNMQADLDEIHVVAAASRADSDRRAQGTLSAREQELQEAIRRVTLASTKAGELIRVQPAQVVRVQAEVAIVSGAMVGLAVAAILSVVAPRTLRVPFSTARARWTRHHRA